MLISTLKQQAKCAELSQEALYLYARLGPLSCRTTPGVFGVLVMAGLAELQGFLHRTEPSPRFIEDAVRVEAAMGELIAAEAVDREERPDGQWVLLLPDLPLLDGCSPANLLMRPKRLEQLPADSRVAQRAIALIEADNERRRQERPHRFARAGGGAP
ncbi:MAG: hypothetical protein U1A78_33630 [Polyangia bacterium]